MNRLKDLVYDIITRAATIGPRRRPAVKKLLIVRVDEIGDYMLWHSFLAGITGAEAYRGYEIHFCGNQSWKSLFNTFDAEPVHQTVWLDKLRFKKNMAYRYRFLRQVYRQRYDTVINPTFSRDKRYDDSIVAAAKAPQALGMVANKETVRPYETGYDRNLYIRLFEHAVAPVFEFERNKRFTEFITGKTSAIADTKIAKHRLPSFHTAMPDNFFVVFPGSRSRARIWPAENFIRVSNYLFETHGWTAVVCGTESDREYTQAFCSGYGHPLVDLTGKTSLVEMLALFTRAQCLLSVDTGSVHLAAAAGCTVFGIFNGSQYGRFAPYPKEIAADFYAIYPDEVEKELQDPELVKQKYEFVVRIPYALVKPEKVIHAIYQHYS
jgi:ADP-heptose:LPS heptosyltransferase